MPMLTKKTRRSGKKSSMSLLTLNTVLMLTSVKKSEKVMQMSSGPIMPQMAAPSSASQQNSSEP